MVDRDLILRRLANLDVYLEQLAPYRGIDAGAYQEDWKTQRIVERTRHLAIRLERLCRYTLRPPLALTRLRVDAEGTCASRCGISGRTGRRI